MFCPRCSAEYREGFYRCPDCDVDLVYDRSPEKEEAIFQDKKATVDNFVKVMRIDSDSDIAFLKSFLDTTDISYYFQSALVSVGINRTPGRAPAYLMVEESGVEAVQELLKDFSSGCAHDEKDNEWS